MGPQRRVISDAFSVDRSANVSSLGQEGSAAGAGDTTVSSPRAESDHGSKQAHEASYMVARRIRDDTTSTAMTMATMSRMTVAASRSLKDRMVSQR